MTDGPVLHFSIDRSSISGNTARRTTAMMVWNPKKGKLVPRARTYLTREASGYREEITVRCQAAAKACAWVMPEYVRCDIQYWNIRQDRTNVMKETEDAMQRVAYANDSRILDGWTRKGWDDGGPRIEIWIRPVDRADYDHRSSARRRKSAARSS